MSSTRQRKSFSFPLQDYANPKAIVANFRYLARYLKTAIENVDHGETIGLEDDDHTQYLKEKLAGGTAAEVPEHDHSAASEGSKTAFEELADAAGDLWYATAADTGARLAIGTADQVLTVNAGATAPEWADATGGSGGAMDDFLLDADAGTPETIEDGDTLMIAGGTGIDTAVAATDTVTVNLDSASVASLALADSATQPGDDADTLGSGTATDGQVLTADGAGAAAWEDLPAAAGHDLEDHDDVVITTPADNEVLAFDSTSGDWINQTPAEAALAAASHTHVEADVTDLDHYDSTDFASDFAGSDLTDLGTKEADDLDATGITDGFVLTADGADGTVWEAAPGAGGGLDNIVEDTTPQLGGDLDANGFDIDMGSGDILELNGISSDGGFLTMSMPDGGNAFRVRYDGTVGNVLSVNETDAFIGPELEMGDDINMSGNNIVDATQLQTEEAAYMNNTDAVKTGTMYVSQVANEERFIVAGGQAGSGDPVITLFGASDSGLASDITFVSGTDNLLQWDESEDAWKFFKPIYVQATPAYLFGGTVYFTSSGNFVKGDYPGLRALKIFCQGGGGAGGGAPATGVGQTSMGLPGGAGSCGEAFVLASALDTTEAVVVGAGGAGASGALGPAGGATSFDLISGSVSGSAGGGGNIIAAGSTNAFGLGGFGTVSGNGDIIHGGDAGQSMYRVGTLAVTANGGRSFLGHGGNRAGSNVNGNPGSIGGGGGGSVNGASQSARTGGDGGDGIVVVELYF